MRGCSASLTFSLHRFQKITGGFADECLLSPALSSTLSGGEGARRAGEEAPLTVFTDSHREMVLHLRRLGLHAAFGTVVGCEMLAAFAFFAFAVAALSTVPVCTMRRAALYCA